MHNTYSLHQHIHPQHPVTAIMQGLHPVSILL